MDNHTERHPLKQSDFLRTNLSRRQFLRKSAQLGVALGSLLAGVSCTSSQASSSSAPTATSMPSPSPLPSVSPASTPTPSISAAGFDIAVARGDSPKAITQGAINAIGGIERFVKRGDVVVIKPNICSSRKPQYAATTNPEVVETLVRMCIDAGAKAVKVFDEPFTGINTAYEESGIAAAVGRAGGQMEKMSSLKFKKVDLPDGKALRSVYIYDDILSANVVINVPIAKDHGLARLTLGMKNLMGVVRDRDRQAFHSGLGQKVADLAAFIRPQLTVVDAVRILTANGPTGGNLADVKQTNTVIASVDMVAADSFATGLFGMTGNDIDYIRRAAEMGLGEINLKKLNIREVKA